MPLNASFFHGQIENGQNRFSPSGGWINNNADIAYLLLHSNFYFDPILLLCQFYSFDSYDNVLARREESMGKVYSILSANDMAYRPGDSWHIHEPPEMVVRFSVVGTFKWLHNGNASK